MELGDLGPMGRIRRGTAWTLETWLGLSLVAAMIWARNGTLWLQGKTLIDEYTYLDAFEMALAGGSPYDVFNYLYSPAFAVWGSWLIAAFGRLGTLWVLRILSFASLRCLSVSPVREASALPAAGAPSKRSDTRKAFWANSSACMS